MEEQTKFVEADATKAELRQKISMISARLESMCDGDHVEWSTAAKFVQESTWWLYHPSGTPRRAPKFKRKLEGQDSESCGYGSDNDWRIKFGGLIFHVGDAICGCVQALDYWLGEREFEGAVTAFHLRQLWVRLEAKIRGSVSHRSGHYYKEYRGKDEGFPDDMIFGTQSIDLRDFRLCFLREAGILDCFDSEQLKEAGILKRAD